MSRDRRGRGLTPFDPAYAEKIGRPKRGAARRLLSLALRLAFSAGLLWLLLRRLSPAELGARLGGFDWRYLGLALSLLLFVTVLASIRWRKVCKFAQCRLERLEAWRLLMIANAFDQFVFNLSGDAYRVWQLTQRSPSFTHAVTGAVLDRIVGVVGLITVIAIGLPFFTRINNVGALALAPALMALSGMAGLAALLLLPKLPLPALPFKDNALLLSGAAREFFLRRPGNAIEALGAAVAVHLGAALVFATLGAGLGLALPIGWYLLVTPPAMMLSLLPISIGGWGVREGAVVVGLGLAGVGRADALLVSVLFGFCSALIGLLGGLVWLVGPPEPGAQA